MKFFLYRAISTGAEQYYNVNPAEESNPEIACVHANALL
jgi:hypothetical protein